MVISESLDLSKGRVSPAWSLDPSLANIFGVTPMEFKMSKSQRAIGDRLCPFPENFPFEIRREKVTRSDPVLDNVFHTQLFLKKVLGALLFSANHRAKDFARSVLSYGTVEELQFATQDHPARADLALSYAMCLTMDMISQLHSKISIAEVVRQSGRPVNDTSDPTENKKKRKLVNVDAEVTKNKNEMKREVALKRHRSFLYNKQSGNLRVSFLARNPNLRGKGNNGSQKQTVEGDQAPKDSDAQDGSTGPRRPYPFHRGRGRGRK